MTHATYYQRTGVFLIHAGDTLLYQAIGYAGRWDGRNRPEADHLATIGPLPRGFYRVGKPRRHPRLGPLALPLQPFQTNEMFGRAGFYIHGDNRTGDASHGCIILNRAAREAIVDLDVATVEVMPDQVQPKG